MREFLRAFNAGHRDELDRLFAAEPDFPTGAPGERVRGDALDRSTLIAYFASRHSFGERLTLRRFRFNGFTDGYGHFEDRLTRRARSLPPTRYLGKGAAICRSGGDVMAVWSMAREQ